MGFRIEVGAVPDLIGLVPWGLFISVGMHYTYDYGAGTTGKAWTIGTLPTAGNNFCGTLTDTPPFEEQNIGFLTKIGIQMFPIRFPVADRAVIGQDKISEAFANLSISNLTGVTRTLNASLSSTFPSTAGTNIGTNLYAHTDGNPTHYVYVVETGSPNAAKHYWVLDILDSTPATLALSLALYGFKHNGDDTWTMQGLGGGGSVASAAAEFNNGVVGYQTKVIDVTQFARNCLASAGNYAAFTFACMPHELQPLIQSFSDDASDGQAFFDLYTQANYGYVEMEYNDPSTGLPYIYLVGNSKSHYFNYDGLSIDRIYCGVGGNIALPDGCRVDGYPPNMTPLT